jgi:hypothetical protein
MNYEGRLKENLVTASNFCGKVLLSLRWLSYGTVSRLSVWVRNLVSKIKGGTQTEVLEKRVLRRIFGPTRDEVKGDWRNQHNEELHNLYSLPNIIRMIKSRRIRWAGHVARVEEKMNACRILVGKPEGKRPLGRPRHRSVDNIK